MDQNQEENLLVNPVTEDNVTHVNGDDVASALDITIDKDRELSFSDIDKEQADEKVEEIEEEHDHKNEKILDVTIEQLDDGLWEKSQEEIFSTLYREYTQPLDFTSIRKVGLFKHFFLWFLVLVK